MTTFLLYMSLTYHWGAGLVVETGPEAWIERPQIGATWVQLAPCVLTYDTDAETKAGLESRINAWIQRPDKAYTRP